MVLMLALTMSCKPSTAVEKDVETEVVVDTVAKDTVLVEDVVAEPIIRQDEQ